MIYPALAPIDWAALVGGDADASGALAARDRKLAATASLSAIIPPLARRLEEQGRLFVCTPEVLSAEPNAARWYLDLAGLTGKLIAKLKPSYASAGMTISPETVAAASARGRAPKPPQAEAFSRWINDTLIQLYPSESRTADLALTTVLAMAGARVDGQVRNQAGDDAVDLLKAMLIGAFAKRETSIESHGISGTWTEYDASTPLLEQRRLRFGGRIVCDFIGGGNRPDIKITVDGVVIVLGEVKGRTDLSNVWESWMPQINGHLQTWAAEVSQAPRVFFGTIITHEMIEGVTAGGTRHTGLRAFANSGLLRAAYNLTNIAKGHHRATTSFDDFVDQLSRNL